MSDTITVTIKYFVSLKEKTGKREEAVGFQPGGMLTDIVAYLNAAYGISLPDRKIMAILNGKGWNQLPEKLATPLRDGDVVCLFPPVSGG
ncbi:MAG: MoaD/ThiS family protein [Spirochaetota bacterium]